MDKKPVILVVDDEERNLRLLESILVQRDYAIVVARNGAEALEEARKMAPEVILLDVMMPVMDGFETCRRLKADAETTSIPVLLVTALDSKPDRLKGIEAGATDFITKPIDFDYLLLKVRNALYAKELFNRVQGTYDKEKKLEQARDKLTQLIVHDLRTPLLGISGHLEILKLQAAEYLRADHKRNVDQASFATQTMVDLINSILAVNHFDRGNIEIHLNQDALQEIAFEAIDLLGPSRTKSNILVTCSPGPGVALGDRGLIRNIMLNLLSNANKYATSGDNFHIAIAAEPEGMRVRVTETDSGVYGRYQNEVVKQFGPAAATEERMMSSAGLGMAFCKMAVEAHGGEIGMEKDAQAGGIFWFFLPWKTPVAD